MCVNSCAIVVGMGPLTWKFKRKKGISLPPVNLGVAFLYAFSVDLWTCGFDFTHVSQRFVSSTLNMKVILSNLKLIVEKFTIDCRF